MRSCNHNVNGTLMPLGDKKDKNQIELKAAASESKDAL
jgi:hypothetical protein